MWIFTTTGFVSAVSDGNQLVVRSRDRQSLEPISTFAKAEIKKSPVSDYPYRLTLPNELFAERVSTMAMSINYRNFKSEVTDLRGDDFAHPLMKVWSTTHEVEDSEARSRR
jgi:hypothetical protein